MIFPNGVEIIHHATPEQLKGLCIVFKSTRINYWLEIMFLVAYHEQRSQR